MNAKYITVGNKQKLLQKRLAKIVRLEIINNITWKKIKTHLENKIHDTTIPQILNDSEILKYMKINIKEG